MSPRFLAHLRTWLALGVALLALAGCRIRDRGEDGQDDGGEELSTSEQEVVDDSTQTEDSVRGDTGLAALPTLAFIGQKGPLTLARAVQFQAAVPVLFAPAKCATVEIDGNIVTYAFDHCTGPLGLAEISGRQIVTFEPGEEVGSIAMTMTSEELTLQGRPVQHDALAVLTITEAGRRVDYQGSFEGTTPRGVPMSHATDLHIETDAAFACVTVDGTVSGSVGPRGLDTTFDQLTRCGAGPTCPSGTITSVARLKKITVSVEFDGTDTAVVTTPKGREIEVDLPCTPQ